MRIAINLAQQGGSAVRPNPLVGAVVVDGDEIVGRGYHTRYGALHAEREALRDAGDAARGCTMYVTLEPCNHHGKTPLCTDALIESGIAKVVVGMSDPNPDVAGNGVKRLQDAGIECEMGVLEQECKEQNEIFLVNIMEKRPFSIVKVAQTLDGFIAPEDGYSKWITGEAARTQAHRLRASVDAIIVGAGTLKQDNPSLTVRHVEGNQPIRIVLSDTLDLPLTANVFTDSRCESTLLLVTDSAYEDPDSLLKITNAGIEVIPVRADSYGKADLNDVMKVLWERGVYALLVEGGAGLYSSFLQANVVDRVDAFIAPKIFGSGVNVFKYIQAHSVTDPVQFSLSKVEALGNDVYAIMRRS